MNEIEAWQTIKDLSREEFDEKIKPQGLPKDREDLLFKFILEEVRVSDICASDIKAYALKYLMPDFYESNPHQGHAYSSNELYEYDPPKNGQNIIKHGIGFGEVVSYSKSFGIVSVPISSLIGDKRSVIFSDLVLSHDKDKLEMPLSNDKSLKYVISIVNQRDRRFRFISARLLSSNKKKYEKTIEQALKKTISDENARKIFVQDCVKVLEERLIKPSQLSP